MTISRATGSPLIKSPVKLPKVLNNFHHYILFRNNVYLCIDPFSPQKRLYGGVIHFFNRFPQRPFSRPLASLFDFGRPPRPRPQRPPSRPPPPPPPPPPQPLPTLSISISPSLALVQVFNKSWFNVILKSELQQFYFFLFQPPVSQQFIPSRPAPPPPPPPSFQQTNDLSFRQPQIITSQNPFTNPNGFGSPRPDSIITISQGPPQQQSRPNPPRPSPQSLPPPQSFSSPQQFTPTQSPFPPPLIGPNSNNIIGMTPPPPPAPTPPPTPPPTLPPIPTQATVIVRQPTTIGALVPITARPSRPLAPPSSNALDDLLVNPVPSLNAGILPLANEKPSETQLFPPFT
ncbi:uncharacterized protein [Palaemon carinicauda]|uniref:uncharacterized protein n=1 Tax=Palaemon carinicauda TaxID=392227 RepID=UPI0035B64E98